MSSVVDPLFYPLCYNFVKKKKKKKERKKRKKKKEEPETVLYCPTLSAMPILFIPRHPCWQSLYWGTADLTFWVYLLIWCKTFTVLVFSIVYVFFFAKEQKKKKENIFIYWRHFVDLWNCWCFYSWYLWVLVFIDAGCWMSLEFLAFQ